MSYQLPPLSDPEQFERLVRDILRRVYDDPGIERFGRKGQSQSGIDGFSPANSKITFQCKLKDTRYKNDEDLRRSLLKETEDELELTRGLAQKPERFIFATTFKNDRALQEKAASLSTDSTTVEYWGWDTINERIWEFAEVLIPAYYPQFPVRAVPGFRQINADLIEKSRISDPDELNKLAFEYYRINDRGDLVFQVVCNDIDVRNANVMNRALRRLEDLPPSGTLWLIGDGGSGKTTILHRIALELSQAGQAVFTLNLEAHLTKSDLESVLLVLRYASAEATVLCIDNPAADEDTLETLLREVPDFSSNIHIVFAERRHRYRALVRTGCLTYLHGEEELEPLVVRNPQPQREQVYDNLFSLLGLSDADAAPLREIALNEQLVYVNATYLILLELKKKRKIDFDFDWDDYRRAASELPAFREGYKYIALFYLFGVRTPFTVFSRICGADEAQENLFLETFRGLVNEPIVVDERRDELFRKNIYLRTKHEIISEIFFQEHPYLNRDELLMTWAEHADFGDPIEAQSLINILGAKKNYLAEEAYVDFRRLIDFLLDGHLGEKVASSRKLYATLHMAKFWLLLLQNEVDEAARVLESFIERIPDDLHSRTELAKTYRRQGKLEKAETLLLRLLELEPDNLQARTELAKIYQRNGKLDEAESILRELLDLDVKNLQARTELSKIYQQQGKLDYAKSILIELLNLDGKNVPARTELAKIYQRQGQLVAAEEALSQVLHLRPSDIKSRTELAKIYQRQNKLEEAEAVLSKILDLSPDDLNARTELAKIYQRQGKLELAIQRLEEEIVLEPRALHPRTELAKIYQRQGKLELAESRLLESLEIDDKQLHPRTELAKIYQRQGKLDLASKRGEEALSIDPLNDFAMSELLGTWLKQEAKDKCAHRFMEFISQPRYRFTRYSQAPVFRFFQCCRRFGMKDLADQVFLRFESELDDRNLQLYRNTFT